MSTAFLGLLLAASFFASPNGVRELKTQVFIFIRIDCPISNGYAVEIQRLYDAYRPHGFEFLLVYPQQGLTESQFLEHQRQYSYSIPGVLDAQHKYVLKTKARVTPEAAVFVNDKEVYLGRIDDWYADFGTRRAHILHHDLEQVLGDISNGKIPAYRETRAIGCAIESVK